jgi:hypothetical protein
MTEYLPTPPTGPWVLTIGCDSRVVLMDDSNEWRLLMAVTDDQALRIRLRNDDFHPFLNSRRAESTLAILGHVPDYSLTRLRGVLADNGKIADLFITVLEGKILEYYDTTYAIKLDAGWQGNVRAIVAAKEFQDTVLPLRGALSSRFSLARLFISDSNTDPIAPWQ